MSVLDNIDMVELEKGISSSINPARTRKVIMKAFSRIREIESKTQKEFSNVE